MGPRRWRAWLAAGRLLVVACAHAREQLQVAGLQIELVDVAAPPWDSDTDELVRALDAWRRGDVDELDLEPGDLQLLARVRAGDDEEAPRS